MRWRVVFALLVLLLCAARGPSGNPPNTDAMKLQGTWAPVSLEINGQPVVVDKLRNARLTVRGEEYVFTLGPDVTLEMTVRLDPGAKPKAIDLTVTAGEDRGKVHHGIYELEGDTFKVCRAILPDRERPTRFETRPESGLMLIVWKRAR